MRKIPLKDLKAGVVLDEDILSTDLQLLLRRGSKLNDYIINKLLERGIEFVVTASTQFEQREDVSLDEHHFLVQVRKNINRVYERSEIESVLPQELLEKTVEVLREIFKDSRMGIFQNLDKLHEEVEMLLKEVVSTSGRAINIYSLANYSDFLFFHAVNVATLMTILYRDDPAWSLLKKDIALGALLHNIGMMRIPVSIFNKPGQLTQREFSMVMEHPRYSYQMVKDNTDVSQDVLKMVLEHHERFDGSGYPQRLTGDAIHPLSLMLSICDTFIALTSERLHRKKLSPNQAISNIIIRSFDIFGSQTVNQFLRVVGLYPVGSLVKLNDGRFAVVFAISGEHLTRPIVKVVYDQKFNQIDPPEMIDLSKSTESYILSPINLYV
ncbi:MAG: HD-GYP domain-containing protein [bacterium]|jgi:HD-GYP domain-containing protein (c-di-GMP phosphodiesterase class II)